MPSPDVVGMTPFSCLSLGIYSGGRATVVGGEKATMVFGVIYAVALAGRYVLLSHYIVHHQDEVAVTTRQSGFSFEGFGGQDGGMRGGQWQNRGRRGVRLVEKMKFIMCAFGYEKVSHCFYITTSAFKKHLN